MHIQFRLLLNKLKAVKQGSTPIQAKPSRCVDNSETQLSTVLVFHIKPEKADQAHCHQIFETAEAIETACTVNHLGDTPYATQSFKI